jgi:hypothetical protein
MQYLYCFESDLLCNRSEGNGLAAMWSHPDLSEPVTVCQYNAAKMGDHKSQNPKH